MNLLHTPQFTLQIEAALRHMVKENGMMSIPRVESLFRTPKGALKQWLDEFNHGNLKISNARIDEVKKEIGAIVVRRIEAPVKAIVTKPAAADDDEIPNSRPAAPIVSRTDKIRAAVSHLKPAPAVGSVTFEDFLKVEGVFGSATIVSTYLVSVSPEIAERWLKVNRGNRHPSAAKIRRFASQMAAGRWTVNGETVKFSKSGRLIDGQSRLRAVIQSRATVVLEVRGGLDDSVQETMDVGQQRTNKDTMHMKGEKYPQILAPALKMMRLKERGQLAAAGKGSGDCVVENWELFPTLERHPQMRDSVARMYLDFKEIDRLMPFSKAAFFHCAFAELDPKKATMFIANLCRPEKGCPPAIAALHEQMKKDKIEGLYKSKVGENFRRLIFVWNQYRGGPPAPAVIDTHAPYPEIR